MEDLERFLSFLYYNQTSGYFCVALKSPNSFKTHFFAILEKKKAIDLISSSCDSNVYLSLNVYKSQERSKESCVDYVNNIFLDFDDIYSFHRFFKRYSKYCTVVESSKDKYQVVLKLKTPIHKFQAETVSKTLATKYNADHAHDCTRLIRCPYTLNYKYNPPFPSSVIQYATYYLPDNLIQSILTQSSQINQTNCLILPRINQTNCLILTGHQKITAREVYQKVLETTPPKHDNTTKDYSIADMKFTIYLLSQNYQEQEIASMLLYISPDIEKRKGKHVIAYIMRTIEVAKEYLKHKK